MIINTRNQEESMKMKKELNEASQPLLEFLYKYGCPHDAILLRMDGAELLSGEVATPFEIRD